MKNDKCKDCVGCKKIRLKDKIERDESFLSLWKNHGLEGLVEPYINQKKILELILNDEEKIKRYEVCLRHKSETALRFVKDYEELKDDLKKVEKIINEFSGDEREVVENLKKRIRDNSEILREYEKEILDIKLNKYKV